VDRVARILRSELRPRTNINELLEASPKLHRLTLVLPMIIGSEVKLPDR
jgi:hypothetical protein